MPDRSDRGLKAYRRLLLLFPRGFRERWGPDMKTLLQHRLDAAGSGRWSRMRAWSGIVADVCMGAVRERIKLLNQRRSGMGAMTQDVRQAIRSLGKSPGAAMIAIATLTLGIGASTTTFSVVNGVMLKPLAFDQPERIVSVWPAANFNAALVREFDAGVPALERVAGISVWTAVLSGVGDPIEIDVGRVSPAFFDVLGTDPTLGRTLATGEDIAEASAVVVLSEGLWRSSFGSDPDVVGRVIELSLDAHDHHVVVGVMPRGFDPPGAADAWAPLVTDPALAVTDDSSWYVNKRIARLREGSTLEQATEQVRALATRFAPEVPNQFSDEIVAAAGVVPLKEDILGEARPALWVLLGAVGLVLLIACANVANLLLARGEARRHDLSIRAALGAGRGRIVRLLLVESMVLGLIGGGLGVAAALVLQDVVLAVAPADIPRIANVAVDGGVLGFTLAITITATLISGLWPALRSSRTDPVSGLGDSGRGVAGRTSSKVVSHALIAAEIALAVVVTLGSGLMLRSLDRMLSVEIGFDAEGVVAFRPNPLGSGREGVEGFRQFYAGVLDRARSVPGIREVGAVQILTGTPNNWSFPTYPEGYVIPESGALPDVNFRAVMPGYFETLRIPLVRGRTILPTDGADSELVVVVNRTFAERFWPGEDPLGKTLNLFGTGGDPMRIVGVVGDIRQHALYLDPLPELYVPYMAWPWEMSAWILARTDNPSLFKSQVRAIVDQVDPSVPVSGVDDLDAVLQRSAGETRFFTVLLTAFGVLGLSLGAIGIYGVTAYTVARRRAEFGVRVALGATRAAVVGSALRTGFTPVLLGCLAGIVLGAGGGGLLRDYLYDVKPTDPATIMAVVLVLGLIATSALMIPAWRASRVNPAEVLGGE